MIRVHFDPEELTGEKLRWWKDWQKRADQATKEAVEAWEDWRQALADGRATSPKFKYDFKASIWGELKDWLLENVFYRKCAYCETPVGRSQFHAEHFRPKGLVKASKQVVKIRALNGQEAEHPGYFWLAYNWENLLPSCALCNTVRGKKNQFPVSLTYASMWEALASRQVRKLKKKRIKSKKLQNVYYLQPEDLDEFEGRLLLHPYRDDPRAHLCFGDCGVVAAVEGSAAGQHSIEVYDLDNEALDAMRYDAQKKAFNQFLFALGAATGTAQDKIRAAEAAIASFSQGQEPYSAAVMDYIELMRKSLGHPAFPEAG